MLNFFKKEKVIKKAFWLFSGYGISKAAKFAILLLSVKYIGVSEFGFFSFVLASSSIGFMGVGLLHILSPLVRDLSGKDIGTMVDRISEELSWRVFLITVFSLVSFLSPVLLKDVSSIYIALILVLSYLFDSLREFLAALLQSQNQMRTEGLIAFWQSVFSLLVFFIVMQINQTSLALVFVYAVSSLFGLVLTTFICKKFFGKSFYFKKLHFSLATVRRSLKDSMGFGLVWSLVINFMFQITVVIAGIYHGPQLTGLVGLVSQFLQAAVLPFSAIALAGLPELSASGNNIDRSKSFVGLIKTSVHLMPVLVLSGLSLASIVVLPLLKGYSASSLSTLLWALALIAPLLSLVTTLLYSSLAFDLFKSNLVKTLAFILFSFLVVFVVYTLQIHWMYIAVACLYLVLIWQLWTRVHLGIGLDFSVLMPVLKSWGLWYLLIIFGTVFFAEAWAYLALTAISGFYFIRAGRFSLLKHL